MGHEPVYGKEMDVFITWCQVNKELIVNKLRGKFVIYTYMIPFRVKYAS